MLRTLSRVHPRARLVVLGAGAAILLWLITAAVMLVVARASVDAGVRRLDEARDQLSIADLGRGEACAPLEGAEHEFDRARYLASSPLLAPLGFVPGIGQQVRSIEAQTDAAAEVVAIGERALEDVEEELAKAPAPGADRVALITRLEAITRRASAALAAVDLGPDFFLIGPVGDAHARFTQRLADVRGALADAQTVTAGFERFLQGPRRYAHRSAKRSDQQRRPPRCDALRHDSYGGHHRRHQLQAVVTDHNRARDHRCADHLAADDCADNRSADDGPPDYRAADELDLRTAV